MAAQVLVISDGTLTSGERLLDAIARGGSVAMLERDPASALARLRTQPRAVVIDAAMQGAEAFIGRIRSEGALSGCAVIAVVPSPSDAAFSEALSWGVDEVVPVASLRALTRVAETLKDHDPGARLPATQGTVLMAAGSAATRLARARPLRNAGFEVRFAASRAEYETQLERDEVLFAVVDSDVFLGGVDELRAMFHGSGQPKPVIAIVPTPFVDSLSADLASDMNVRILAAHDPTEDAIFLGNELVRPSVSNLRTTPRLLYATVASFRRAGHEHSTHGITYNVSGEGLYVRTLVPLPIATPVWLELRPPGSDEFVQLEMTVVWTRRFGPSAGATAPAGFGARFTGGSERSMAKWNAGYNGLLQVRRGMPQA